MKKRTATITAATLLLMLVMLASCGKSSETTASSPAEGTVTANTTTAASTATDAGSISQQKDIIAGITVDFTTMDPLDTSDTLSGGIQRMIMDGLFGFDDEMNIFPMLASGYTANDEATEFTITLRTGISFTDGTPWNADAALANVARWADKTLGLKRTTFLSGVLKSWEKIDDYTIKINLVEPFGAFISNLAHPACVIMSPKQIEAGLEATAYAPVGTGQYTFVEWVQGDHLTLKLNEDWWGYDSELSGGTALADKDAGFKTITFKPVSEGSTRVAMLMSGDAHIIWPVPAESMSVLENDSSVTVSKDEGIVVRYFILNFLRNYYSIDLKDRKAIDKSLQY